MAWKQRWHPPRAGRAKNAKERKEDTKGTNKVLLPTNFSCVNIVVLWYKLSLLWLSLLLNSRQCRYLLSENNRYNNTCRHLFCNIEKAGSRSGWVSHVPMSHQHANTSSCQNFVSLSVLGLMIGQSSKSLNSQQAEVSALKYYVKTFNIILIL